MTTIEVRISKHKLEQLQHEIHIANFTLKALKDAGIPVRGALFVVWVESGSLTVEVDSFAEDELVYTWTGEIPASSRTVDEMEEELS